MNRVETGWSARCDCGASYTAPAGLSPHDRCLLGSRWWLDHRCKKEAS